VVGRGTRAQRHRRADADRPGPCRRVQHQPPGAGLGATLGQSKAEALRERIADIHPGCKVHAVEEFVDEGNWPALLPQPVDAVIDACDQVRAKAAMAAWAATSGTLLVMVGAAGGKHRAQAVELGDLSEVTHDPLLASLRQRLRKQHGGRRDGKMGLRCVFLARGGDGAAQMPAMSTAASIATATVRAWR
jgi:tRNA A37 threonylcarbamoyladenosine dehydratase